MTKDSSPVASTPLRRKLCRLRVIIAQLMHLNPHKQPRIEGRLTAPVPWL
jgi:hypothetical protein